MKKKIIALVMLVCIIVCAVCLAIFVPGRNKPDTTQTTAPTTLAQEQVQTDYTTVYTQTIYNIYQYALDTVYGNISQVPASEQSAGVADAVAEVQPGDTEFLKKLGYVIEDINGDGVYELLVLSVEETDGEYTGQNVLCAFTYTEETIRKILDGGIGSRYCVLEDNLVYFEGSAGTSYSIVATYELAANSAEMTTKDYYFSYPDFEDSSKVNYYYNSLGESMVESAELLKDGESGYLQIKEGLEKKIKSYTATSFEMYDSGYDAVKTYSVYAVFAEDNLIDLSSCHRYVADTSEDSREVVFFASGEVYDFSFCRVNWIDSSAEDGASYECVPVHTIEVLTEYEPLVVTMTFDGDVPSYGFTYVDQDGVGHTGTIGLSGEDGSIVLDII